MPGTTQGTLQVPGFYLGYRLYAAASQVQLRAAQ